MVGDVAMVTGSGSSSICRIFAVGALVATDIFSGGAANAQLSRAWTRCANKEKASPDLQISGCTTVIQSGKETQKNRAVAYTNRGNAYLGKKDYDRAIADYNKAIELEPKLAAAYANRGLAYGAKGDIDGAIADLDKAIDLNPKLAHAYANRGLAY